VVLDTSALLALLGGGEQASRLVEALEAADTIRISAATVVEAGIACEVRWGEIGGRELDLLLHRLGADVVAVTDEHAELARDGYRRFGGRHHPAGLTFGDCFAYALAVSLEEPLLFTGENFAHTDVAAALS
jgi:ribonuclease VapC